MSKFVRKAEEVPIKVVALTHELLSANEELTCVNRIAPLLIISSKEIGVIVTL